MNSAKNIIKMISILTVPFLGFLVIFFLTAIALIKIFHVTAELFVVILTLLIAVGMPLIIGYSLKRISKERQLGKTKSLFVIVFIVLGIIGLGEYLYAPKEYHSVIVGTVIIIFLILAFLIRRKRKSLK